MSGTTGPGTLKGVASLFLGVKDDLDASAASCRNDLVDLGGWHPKSMKGVITRQGNLQKRSFLHLDLGRREVEPFCHDTYFLDFTALAGLMTRLGGPFLPIAQDDQKKDDRHLVLPTMMSH